jgi:hypothetical protein
MPCDINYIFIVIVDISGIILVFGTLIEYKRDPGSQLRVYILHSMQFLYDILLPKTL